MKKIIALYKQWRFKKEWSAERQIAMLRTQINSDYQWLCSDPKAEAILRRYKNFIEEDWMRYSPTPISKFRKDIGCEPEIK